MTAPITTEPDTIQVSAAHAEVWALVKRTQAGEIEAFGSIYSRYFDVVFGVVYSHVSSLHLAEELTSEALLRALEHIDGYTYQGRDFGAWVVTIARNLVRDYYKSKYYCTTVLVEDLRDCADESRRADPVAAAINALNNVWLRDALAELTKEQRQCIVLRFLKEYSVAETGKEMGGLNESAIKSLQYRAIRSLRRYLPPGVIAW